MEPFNPYAVIEGILIDQQTQEPISFGTVGIRNSSIGTVTNQNGEFRLNIPDSLSTGSLYFSHVGYLPQEVHIAVLINHHTTFSLEPKNISIQEVIVRLVNPQKIIRDMLDKRKDNYASTPVYFTTFYREGVERKKGFVNLSEAVFKVYKNPLQTLRTDQVKLLKMRKISNTAEKDTIITKIKSEVNACLLLDLVKNLPDFLSPESLGNYEYRHTDLTLIEDRMANVITFEQRASMKEPLYKGDLYIDTENDALLMAKFEMNPDHIKAATSMFIEKKSRSLSLKLDKVQYAVSYKYWNGKYYINHIRGDLHFKIRTKKQFFSSPVHTWFEMVTCDIETEDVSRFMRNETFPQTTVFSDMNFVYDNEFWGNFNIILPEEELHEAISRITSKIEETNL
ncbi:MAG: carboxypeptidase-like regulatory domain-containing protein [Tannerellaceae bacterium]|nr:carboxypeptidase-like regulatory domain-containing protein [Tannerellaceae bacterium]